MLRCQSEFALTKSGRSGLHEGEVVPGHGNSDVCSRCSAGEPGRESNRCRNRAVRSPPARPSFPGIPWRCPIQFVALSRCDGFADGRSRCRTVVRVWRGLPARVTKGPSGAEGTGDCGRPPHLAACMGLPRHPNGLTDAIGQTDLGTAMGRRPGAMELRPRPGQRRPARLQPGRPPGGRRSRASSSRRIPISS